MNAPRHRSNSSSTSNCPGLARDVVRSLCLHRPSVQGHQRRASAKLNRIPREGSLDPLVRRLTCFRDGKACVQAYPGYPALNIAARPLRKKRTVSRHHLRTPASGRSTEHHFHRSVFLVASREVQVPSAGWLGPVPPLHSCAWKPWGVPGRWAGNTHFAPGVSRRMRIIVTLSASLAMGLVAFGFGAGQAQAGFCQYQYKHCVARCASKVIKIKRQCVPACRMQFHHCKTPDPHLGELTGTP